MARDDKGRVTVEPSAEAVAAFDKEETERQDALRLDLNARYALLETDAQREIFRHTFDYHPGPPSKEAKKVAKQMKEVAPGTES